MKNYVLTAVVLFSMVLVAAFARSAVQPASPVQPVMNNTIDDKKEIVERYDRHIEDVQKRYDCVKAAQSDEDIDKCDRNHIPERGCEGYGY